MQLRQLNYILKEVLRNEDISLVLFLREVFKDNTEYVPGYPFLLNNLSNILQLPVFPSHFNMYFLEISYDLEME
jgi:hypothetical protein